MSQRLISRSPDLKRLRDEGYDVTVRGAHLLLAQVPYLNQAGEVCRGTLISELTLSGDRTAAPSSHVVMFSGETPCDKSGAALPIINSGAATPISDGVVANFVFSSKPPGGYKDYYDKMTAYVNMLAHQARAVDESVSPTVFPAVAEDDAEGIFHYYDTATSRAGIDAVAQKLHVDKVAIVGLGGTGGYVLDLISKVPIGEIHLFDGDRFLNHNAFRAPGAASLEELQRALFKVDYFTARYSNMHRRIVAHPYFVTADHLGELVGMDFVFLCVDSGAARGAIVSKLESAGVSFLDVGMGVQEVGGALGGQLRATLSTDSQRDHVHRRVNLSETDLPDDYDQNIQVADLNALNAALAVIKWKKTLGFYRDLEREHHSIYDIDGNAVINEESA